MEHCSASLVCAVLLCLCLSPGQGKIPGKPEPPNDVIASNVTYNSADVHWTSGSDGGSHERFFVVRYVGRGTTYITMSSAISMLYNGTGSGLNWTHHLAALESDTVYRVAVLAKNKNGESFSPTIVFRTSTWPHNTNTKSYAAIAVACVVVVGVCLALVGFVVYIICRKRRKSEVTCKSPLVQNQHE